MTIWLLALVLLLSLAGLGYRQGAIRVAFSLLGILVGALLAAPLGRLLKPVFLSIGVKNPMLIWALGPVVVFVLISALFKVAALTAHQKADVHYKYHAGELRLVLWERLNRRLGLCLGLLNGTLYLLLISMVIYSFGYWTVQLATAETDPGSVRFLNRLGRDLEGSGLNKAAAAIDPMPPAYFQAADLAGLIFNNSLLEARLARYPAFLSLAERPEFQDLANDQAFTEMRLKQAAIRDVLDYPKVQTILQNRDLLQTIWSTLIPDLKDLRTFLETGQSPKYDAERILGRWNFDVNAALILVRRTKPNMTSTEMKNYKRFFLATYAKTSFVAATDHQAILKNAPRVMTPAGGAPSTDLETRQGQWLGAGGKYLITFTSGSGEAAASVEGDRLTLTGPTLGQGLAFTREN